MTSPHIDKTKNASELITVEGPDGPKEFCGKLLVDVSTEKPKQPRWTEMQLYRKDDGGGAYVLYSVGRSVVYHDPHGECNKGIRKSVKQLYTDVLDAEPCDKCEPEDYERLPLDSYVMMEEDRPKIFVCHTAEQVVSRLRFNGGNISGIGQQLLREAKLIDPAFDDIFRRPQRI